MVRPAADGFMVDSRGDAARLIRSYPGNTVVVRVRDFHRVRTKQGKLSCKDAAVECTEGISEASISEADRVGIDHHG